MVGDQVCEGWGEGNVGKLSSKLSCQILDILALHLDFLSWVEKKEGRTGAPLRTQKMSDRFNDRSLESSEV